MNLKLRLVEGGREIEGDPCREVTGRELVPGSCRLVLDLEIRWKENCILLKIDGNPISLQERACLETTYPRNPGNSML